MSISVEDALSFLVQRLRRDVAERGGSISNYGYQCYVPSVLREYYRETQKQELQQGSKEQQALAPAFLNAAWELCRRGVLRPGVTTLNAQSTADGSAGSGYSITPFGRAWLAEADGNIFVPTEPERFAQLLEPYRLRFGAGFHERAQQALRCYDAHAYFACCAMCGAASESILLAAAVSKVGAERATKTYLGANGRSRLENLLLGQIEERVRRDVLALNNLLKYWRDSSAHGHALNIGDNEAFTSLALLLRLAMVVEENWPTLASPPAR